MKFRLVDKGWSKVMQDAVALKAHELRIMCPFIKVRALERLLDNPRLRSIQILTRFNLNDFSRGVSDTQALRVLLKRGAQIRGVKKLHSKLYLFGGNRVIVTSANLTEAALRQNHEFGFVSDDDGVIKQCSGYFEQIWKDAGDNLTVESLIDWECQLAAVNEAGAPPTMQKGLPDYGANIGYAEPFVLDTPFIEGATQAYVKFFGASNSRQIRTQKTFDEIERSGCHWACSYPKRPRRIQDEAIMFISRLVKEPNDILIYGRAIALAHLPGRDDATQKDLARRPWKRKWPYYIRVHHAEFLGGKLENGVSLNQLMSELGSRAFESTKQNECSKTGNMNPRLAYLQQADVRLSVEGLQWVEKKLEVAFRRNGKIPASELEQLDWPEVPKSVAKIIPVKTKGTSISGMDSRSVVSQKRPNFNTGTNQLSMTCRYANGKTGIVSIKITKDEKERFLACGNFSEATQVARKIYERFGPIKNPAPRRIVQNTLASTWSRADLRHGLYR